jgi:hypothetical protein
MESSYDYAAGFPSSSLSTSYEVDYMIVNAPGALLIYGGWDTIPVGSNRTGLVATPLLPMIGVTLRY